VSVIMHKLHRYLEPAILLAFIAVPSSIAAMISPAMPYIYREFSLHGGDINLIMSAFMCGFMGGQLIYGPLGDRIGRVASLQTGLSINLIGLAIIIASVPMRNFPLMVFGRLVSGFGAAAGLVSAIVIINERHHDGGAKKLLSYAIIAFVASINLGILLAGAVTKALGLLPGILCQLLYGVGMLALSRLVPDEAHTKGAKEGGALQLRATPLRYAVALKSKNLVMYSVILAVSATISYTYAAEGALIADATFGVGAAEFGAWNLLNACGTLVGGLCSSRIGNKWSEKSIIGIGLLLALIGIVSLSIMGDLGARSAPWFFVSTAIMFCAQGLIYPSATHHASIAGDDIAIAAGMINFISMGLGTTLVLTMGYVPFNEAMWKFIAVNIFIVSVSALCLWRADIKKRKPTGVMSLETAL
jgi:DHA1 family bicyclomycin/chloramphenicol resistance-like MFS transporter